jgi:mono/diheme cytochrome c family protein
MKFTAPFFAVSSLLLTACGAAREPSRDAALLEAGRDLVHSQCARCHGVGRMDDSPLAEAPPFWRLHERYPVEQLGEAFAEGIVVGHSEMPAFQLQPHEVAALLAYLKSLERRPRY